MDYLELIKLVKQREELYNKKHFHHRNRPLVNALWENIAKKLNSPVFEVKRKWRNLRSNYMREKRKVEVADAKSELIEISWPFYHMMSFLDNCTIKGPGGFNPSDSKEWKTLLETIRDNELGNKNKEKHTSDNNKVIYVTDSEEENEETNPKKKLKKENNSDDEADRIYMHLEKLSSFDPDNDPDLLFFKSLIPQTKKLDANTNMNFKAEVTQLLVGKLQPSSKETNDGDTNDGNKNEKNCVNESTHMKNTKLFDEEDFETITGALKIIQKSDQYDSYGDYVASELRSIKSDFIRRRLQGEIRRAIVRAAEDDDLLSFGSVASTSSLHPGTSDSPCNNTEQESSE